MAGVKRARPTKSAKGDQSLEPLSFTANTRLTEGWPHETQKLTYRWEYLTIPDPDKVRLEEPWIFTINGLPNEMIAPQVYLKILCQVVRDDGTENGQALTEWNERSQTGDDVAPVNNMLNSIVKMAEISIDNEQVTQPQFYHPWVADLMAFFQSRLEYKLGFLQGSGYIEDTDSYQADESNLGYQARKDMIRLSKNCELFGPLMVNLFNQPKPFPPNLEMKIKIFRNPAHFVLTAPEENKNKYRIIYKKVEMRVRRIILQKEDGDKLNSQMLRTPFKYPFVAVETRLFEIPLLTRNVEKTLFEGGPLPSKVTFIMLSQNSLLDNLHANPYRYLHLNLEQIYLECNGKLIPSTIHSYNFGGKDGISNMQVQETIDLWANLYLNHYSESPFSIMEAPLVFPPSRFSSGKIMLPFYIPRQYDTNHHVSSLKKMIFSKVLKFFSGHSASENDLSRKSSYHSSYAGFG